MVVEAVFLLRDPVPAEWKCEKFQAAGRPDLVLKYSKNPDSPRLRILRAEAFLAMSAPTEAWAEVDMILAVHARPGGVLFTSDWSKKLGDPDADFKSWTGNRADRDLAMQAAGSLWNGKRSGESLARMRQISASFPAELELDYLCYGLARDLGDSAASARIGLGLARKLTK